MIVGMFLFSVFSSERWEVRLDRFQAPPKHSIQRLWLIDHGSLNYGWPQSCAKFTSHRSKETNSRWAKPYELITKAHWDKWESIRFLFKGPGVLHSVCCSSINVGVLDHVYGHNSFCKTVAASAETNSGVLSSYYPEHLSPHWANNREEVGFKTAAYQSSLYNKYFHMVKSQFSEFGRQARSWSGLLNWKPNVGELIRWNFMKENPFHCLGMH